MNEIEITEIPPLDASERTLVDMHSLLNVFNVLRGEIALIGLGVGDDPEYLGGALLICDKLIADLRNSVASIGAARAIDQHIDGIRRVIDEALESRPEKREDPEIRESLANLDSVFSILRVRAREILARVNTPDRWVEFSIEALKADFLAVFAAIERNSRGRFRILYNLARQEALDYYVDLKFESVDAPKLWMPAVFQDVMRDLIANARKYTPPGGRIAAALYAGADALRFSVEDTGRGIPEGEVPLVVQFGRRASNVGDVRTMGGGFGLTKAFLTTKQFGGRFYIRSRVGVGTSIRIVIPRPALVGQ